MGTTSVALMCVILYDGNQVEDGWLSGARSFILLFYLLSIVELRVLCTCSNRRISFIIALSVPTLVNVCSNSNRHKLSSKNEALQLLVSLNLPGPNIFPIPFSHETGIPPSGDF